MNNNSLDTTEIGKRIKELRRARGLDQLQASQIIGVSRSQWSNLENGKRNLNIQQIKTIADYFGVTACSSMVLIVLNQSNVCYYTNKKRTV
jgi:transcriptional regulator with XRE-family HTH domain